MDKGFKDEDEGETCKTKNVRSGIRTHAPEETGALIQRLRPLGHPDSCVEEIALIWIHEPKTAISSHTAMQHLKLTPRLDQQESFRAGEPDFVNVSPRAIRRNSTDRPRPVPGLKPLSPMTPRQAIYSQVRLYIDSQVCRINQ